MRFLDTNTLDRLEAQAKAQGTVTLDSGVLIDLIALARPTFAEQPDLGPVQDVFSGDGRYECFEGEPLVWGFGAFCRVQMYTNDDLGYGGLVLANDQNGTVVQQLARLFGRRTELAFELFAPAWKYSPEWAAYLAKNEEGRWFWYETKPDMYEQGGYWWLHPDEGRSELAGNEWLGTEWAQWSNTGSTEDWRQTLAARPA